MKPIDHIATIVHESGIVDTGSLWHTFFLEFSGTRFPGQWQDGCDSLAGEAREGSGT